jgi:rod shape-determining protein MreD
MAIGGCAPHLALAGLVLMAMRIPGRRALLLAAVWGLLSDCLSDSRLGADVIGFVLAVLFLKWGSIRLGLYSPWRLAGFSTPIAWCCTTFSLWLRMHADGRVAGLWDCCITALGSALYAGAAVGLASLAARIISRQEARDTAAAPAVSNKWRMLTE